MQYSLFLLTFLISFIVYSGNAQVINAGIGGNSTVDLLHRIEKNVINENPDLTILMVGTNDMLNSKKRISYINYAENLNLLVEKLKSKGIEVLIMSPPPVDSSYLFMRHDRNLYSETPNEIMDSARQIVQEIASNNNVFFLDIFEKFTALNLPVHNNDLFFRNPQNSGAKDGVHPTALGYHFIAANVFQFLKDNNLLKNEIKIICFGDSITFGSGSKGGGTVSGENYPSFLAKMIASFEHTTEINTKPVKSKNL